MVAQTNPCDPINRDVAWYITHAMYSNVSLFLEKFPSPTTYLFRGQELPILSSPSTVDPSMMTHVTHHGPVILGSPDQGWGVSMRWLGAMLDSEAVKEGQVKWVPNRFMDCLEPMMRAGTVDELDEGGQLLAGPWLLCALTLLDIAPSVPSLEVRKPEQGIVHATDVQI